MTRSKNNQSHANVYSSNPNISNKLPFRFADRTHQRKVITRFIGGEEQNRILWVHGASGNGITRVLHELISPNENVEVCYIDLPEHDSYDAFIAGVEKIRSVTLSDFRKRSFTCSTPKLRVIPALAVGASEAVITAISGDPVQTASIFNDTLTTHAIVSFAEDAKAVFQPRRNNGPGISSTVLVEKYLIDGPKSKVIFVFDNFSRCDEDDASKLYDIILSLTSKKSYGYLNDLFSKSVAYFVIATIQEDLDRRPDLKSMIYNMQPLQLHVDRLKKHEHFSRMLSNAFDLTGQGEIIEHLFETCDGNPGRLEEIVTDIYCMHPDVINRGITLAHIEEAAIERPSIPSPFDFDAHRYPAGFMLLCLAATDIPWPLPLLKLGAEQYGAKSNKTTPIPQTKFDEAVRYLLRLHCRIDCPQAVDNLVLNGYDTASILKDAYLERKKNDPFDRWLHAFMLRNLEAFKSAGVGSLTLQRAIFDCSLRSGMTSKTSEAFGYAQNCLSLGRVHRAAEAFGQLDLNACDSQLTILHRLFIASVFYDAGRYEDALLSLGREGEIISELKAHDQKNLIPYCCMLSETESMLLTNKNKALEHISQAEASATTDSEMFHVSCIKQKVLTNLGANRAKAKVIYDNSKGICPNSEKKSISYARLLSTSVEFYRGGQAQKDLNEAMSIAINKGDIPMQGAIVTNRAFDLFWQGRIKESARHSVEAVRILAGYRPHEISYPLNNLANCQMMLGKFDRALDTIERALLWNKSSYLLFTLKNAEMISSALVCNEESVKKKNRPFEIAKELLEELDKIENIDVSIRINVLYNIEKMYQWSGEPSPIPVGAALALAREQAPSDLPYLWLEGFRDDIERDMQIRLKDQHFPWFEQYRFEPWLVSLTHDRQLDKFTIS